MCNMLLTPPPQENATSLKSLSYIPTGVPRNLLMSVQSPVPATEGSTLTSHNNCNLFQFIT